jgi:transcriptional regulator with XRE-family HTH domain
MKLADYLAERKITPSRFAADVGVPASTISRILSGDRSPSMQILAKINSATNGAVTPNDFLPEPSAETSGESSPFTEAAQ